jgi:Protein of unknown function (DUF5672)
MQNLNNVTLLSVSGNEIFLEKTIRAAEYSCRDFQFKTVICSNVPFEHPFIEYVPIEPLTYQGYSDFCLTQMVDYFDTSHVLIFQEDGFVLDVNKWQDKFLEYDYIGAPWPNWNDKYTIGPKTNVGNGGFSLRSKRLLEAVREVCDVYEDHRPIEDALICRKYRSTLEKMGFKWPSIELAVQFSVEHPIPENGFNAHNPDIINSFGFHAPGKQSGYLKLLENFA